MQRSKATRPVVPGGVLALALVPFAGPAALTLVLALAVDWPRDIAPGSGLKLVGLAMTAVVALAAWGLAVRGVADPRVRRLGVVLCGAVGLLAWPIWSVGVLPSVNGAALGQPREVEMSVERTETTTQQRSRALNHWAWLQPVDGGSGVPGGRYAIPKDLFDQLAAEPFATLTVQVAPGLLGAMVVTEIH